jgi:hypothetical protein
VLVLPVTVNVMELLIIELALAVITTVPSLLPVATPFVIVAVPVPDVALHVNVGYEESAFP